MDETAGESLNRAFIAHFYITFFIKNSQHVSFGHSFPDSAGVTGLFFVLLFWISSPKAQFCLTALLQESHSQKTFLRQKNEQTHN